MRLLPADLRFALRAWRRRPVLIAAAILTLALGTGANTAIFSVIHSVMLRPLPYPQPDRLVQIWSADIDARGHLDPTGRNLLTDTVVDRWRRLDTPFAQLACYRPWTVSFAAPAATPERFYAAAVSPEFFDTLGIAPALGRGFAAGESAPGRDAVVILSDALWRRAFQGSPSVLGATIAIDSVPNTVIGVLPSAARIQVASLREDPDLYIPISTLRRGALRRTSACVVGRLKPGIALPAALAELDPIVRRLGGAEPRRGPQQGVRLVPLRQEVASRVRPMLLVLFGATLCVLLIACANLANLSLAHIAARQKELVVRTALGAPRWRIVRQILTESVALSLSGGVCGLLLSRWLVQALVNLYPGTLPRLESLHASPAVFLFSLVVTLTAGLAAGTFPAWRFSRADLHGSLKDAGALSPRSRRGAAFRGVLVAAQVAATFVLLIATGLLLRSFLLLRAVDPGYRPRSLLTAQIILPEKTYGSKPLQVAFADRFLERVSALPAVESAAITNSLPLAYNFLLTVNVSLDGATPETRVQCRAISPEYFRAMGIPLLAGRPFEPADSARGGVVIVNQSFVRKYFASGNPLGRALRMGEKSVVITGIAADVKNRALDARSDEEIYLPFAQMPNLFLDVAVAVRPGYDPAGLVNGIRAELRAIDPDQPLSRVQTMEEILAGAVAPRRFQATLLGALAALALCLAMVGTYGVVAYSVSLRTREIGIRMALGARRPEVLRLVLGRAMLPVLAGVACGIPAALAATRALASWLYGVGTLDAPTYAGVALLMLAVPLLASYVPARRATAIDPLAALRYE
jgi:putative ABC transport system permease protein